MFKGKRFPSSAEELLSKLALAIGRNLLLARVRLLAPLPECGFGTVAVISHASGVQEASPEGWQEISPGWSASDTRGCSFNANRTPEGCEDNLDSSSAEEGSFARVEVTVIPQVC